MLNLFHLTLIKLNQSLTTTPTTALYMLSENFQLFLSDDKLKKRILSDLSVKKLIGILSSKVN